jgi:hypothetical protein
MNAANAVFDSTPSAKIQHHEHWIIAAKEWSLTKVHNLSERTKQ